MAGMSAAGPRWARAGSTAIALAAVGAAATCWLVLVPLCLDRLPAWAGFVLAGLAAALGVVMFGVAALAVWHAWGGERRDGE